MPAMSRVTLLVDRDEQTSWYRPWVNGVLGHVDAYPVVLGREDELPPLPDQPVIVSRYHLHRHLDKLPPCSAILAEHGVWSPLIIEFESPTQTWSHPAVRAIMAVSWAQAEYMRRTAPVPVWALGFPYVTDDLDVSQAPDWHTREKLVVFPQRIHEDTSPATAVRIALMLIERGWRVVFTVPHTIPAHYPVEAWRSAGIEVYEENTREQYLDLLQQARFAIGTTEQGVLGIALYEAALLGTIPVAPDGNGELPFAHPHFIRSYRVQDRWGAVKAVENWKPLPDGEVRETWFNPVDFGKRLAEHLHEAP